ncbi:MAG: cytochrome-c peroxidase, partial [Leptospiraceae bacterium]|nr:cytochrome-c peroxidase [Leptospiraceae bacterium]
MPAFPGRRGPGPTGKRLATDKPDSGWPRLLGLGLALLCILWPLYSAPQKVNEPIKVLQEQGNLNPDKVQLGEQLFRDVRLSANNTISCSSCHVLELNGADPRVPSVGIQGRMGGIKAPTVYNSSLNLAQFWDG